MRRAILWLLLMATAALPAGAVRAADRLPPGADAFADVLTRVLPAVVNLSVIKVEAMTPSGGEMAARRLRFFGSGFIIDPSGIIVTNRHVIQGAVQITASFADNTQARASLIGAAGLADLAVLKVDVGHKLPALRLADSDRLRIGDVVLAIGNPYGLGTSVSHGIVSGLNRNLDETPFDDDIQTDAAINPGNSGGPMVDLAGEVVGVDTALYTQSNGGAIGIGYAIPSNDAAFVVFHLLDPHLPPPGWIGVTGQDMTPDLAKAFGLRRAEGIILKAVAAGGPAQQAGLRPSDIVLSVAGAAPGDTRALLRNISRIDPGRKIQIAYWRNDTTQNASVTVGAWPEIRAPKAEMMAPEAVADMAPSPDLGMGLASITPEARQHYGLAPSLNGVLVALVSNETEASERGVEAGDVITNVDGVPVTTPDEIEDLIAKAATGPHRYLGFLIVGKSGLNWVSFYTGRKQAE